MKSQFKKVYVAMSGGVDSSVAAALLKKQGYNVTGVFMRPWQPWPGLCMWQGDREDAMRAASVLGIPLLTWDFSKEYKKEVGDYMVREYKAGRTPNPDVMCNKEIKFGLFFKKAMKEGADFIATGHYVKLRKPAFLLARFGSRAGRVSPKAKSERSATMRILAGNSNGSDKDGGFRYSLFQAKDKNKDQSYFLWTLTQKQLSKCLFPVGNYVKPEIRRLAAKFGLSNHDKKDSQGVCFIGPLDMKSFLTRYIRPKAGKILNKKGIVVGKHDGVFYYTIGQRHGLNIGDGGGPYYVTGKDIKKNLIYVGEEKDLMGLRTKITGLSWVAGKIKFPAKVDVKIRYRSKSEKAILKKNGTLKFIKPIRAITSGQSAVFYKEKEMLGGGIIN